jgi:alpha-tubulin suppressor-like RCC1 family protein
MPKGIIGSRIIDKIAMGGSHVLVTTTDKLMFAFGGNTYAQLGDSTRSKLITVTLTLKTPASILNLLTLTTTQKYLQVSLQELTALLHLFNLQPYIYGVPYLRMKQPKVWLDM